MSNTFAHDAPPGTPFEPIAEAPRYRAPRATIDPERSKSWLSRVIPIMKSHRSMFVPALVLAFVGQVLQVVVPKLIQDVVNLWHHHAHVPLAHYVVITTALGVGASVCAYLSRLWLLKTAYAVEFDLRNIIYEHLSTMSFPFYDRVQSGQLISRANSDIRSVQMYMTFAPMILVQCSIAVVAFVVMLTINVPLTFVAMITMPFVYLVGMHMRKTMFPVSWLIQSRLADVATIVDENVNGVRVVKSFAAEPQQLHALARSAKRVEWSYIKDADLRARWTPAVQNLPQVGLALVLLFGGYQAVFEHTGPGAVVAFNLYLFMLQAPFMMLGMLVMMGQRASASAGRIFEILDEAPSVVDRPGAVDLAECAGDLVFEGVEFAYGGDTPQVLDGFSLHIAPGETVALVGRTGSGKSTVARLLARFYDVDGGAVRIDGHDVRDVTLASLRARVGVVLDEPFLFSASVRDNIAYGRPDAALADIEAAARAAGAHGFISELADGYDTVVGERGYTLSGGQRQRVAIARTLLVNPPVLVLDDATSAIDVQVEQQIHEALRVLMKGRTTLIVAHRLSTISLAERVILLDHGRVAADGTHAELLATNPTYAEVLAQAEVEDDAEEPGDPVGAVALDGVRFPADGPRANGHGSNGYQSNGYRSADDRGDTGGRAG